MGEYKIEPIRERRNKQLLSFMYVESKNKNNLNMRNINLTLRSDARVKFREIITKKTTVQNSPYFRGIALWNKLPEAIQKLETLSKFKYCMKQYKIKDI